MMAKHPSKIFTVTPWPVSNPALSASHPKVQAGAVRISGRGLGLPVSVEDADIADFKSVLCFGKVDLA